MCKNILKIYNCFLQGQKQKNHNFAKNGRWTFVEKKEYYLEDAVNMSQIRNLCRDRQTDRKRIITKSERREKTTDLFLIFLIHSPHVSILAGEFGPALTIQIT